MIYLFGASGHGKVALEVAEANSRHIAGFLDDDESLQTLLDLPVFHEIPGDLKHLFISIGGNKNRQKISRRFEHLDFITLIHPFTSISKRAEIGDGTLVMPGVKVNSGSRIGKHCILNTNSSIDHDCEIGDFVHISPQAGLAGNVKVGEGSQIGIGASVIQGIHIGRWCTIGAGAVVIRDVPDYATVVGNPAKILKINKE